MPGWRFLTKSRGPSLPTLPPGVAQKLGLKHYAKNILSEMSKEEIHRHFGWTTTRNLQLDLFFKNVIWQFYELIQTGNPPDFYHKRGFIRGMWYEIKTPMSSHGFGQFKSDLADTMGRSLARLVEEGLCTYKDFQFTDDNASARVIGHGNPHVILMTEKEGFFGMLKDASRRYGCTVVATGGMGSFLSTNYMVSEIAEQGVDVAEQEFAILSLVDFDPTGYDIARSFLADLQHSGVRRFRQFEQYGRKDYAWQDLIRPSTLEPGQKIKDHTYRLKKKFIQPPEAGGDPWAKRWARTTGGVDGKGGQGEQWKLGMEADEFREAYVSQLVDRFIQPLLTVPADVVQRRSRMMELEAELGRYLVHRLTAPSAPGPAG